MSPRRGSTRGRSAIGPSASQRDRRDVGPITAKGQERRREIVTAARRVFEDRGFLETRVADIVEAAEVAQGTFYTYFDSKEAVFSEVANEVIRSMMDSVHGEHVDGLTPEERARAAMLRFINAFRPNAAILGLLEQVGTFTPEMAKLRLSLRESFVDRLANGISRLQSDGTADPLIDPQMVAEVLGAMVDQTCYMWFFLGKDYDETKVVDTLTMVWSRSIGIRGA